ncbi:MAG: type VI secretion system lipoprotein TssJ [Gammaproteobacteria bacterium]|nr:type VI secretion system lipoprotein TssJ [Gammaproteobacteria bacterium]
MAGCIRALVVIASALLLSGCLAAVAGSVAGGVAGKLLEDDPPEVNLTIQASKDLNPNSAGEPSQVVITLYELKSEGAFNSASFAEIYQQGSELLGDDLIKKDEIVIEPGEVKVVARVLDAEARYLGMVAGFRDWQNAKWRGVLATPLDETIDAQVDLHESKMSLSTK